MNFHKYTEHEFQIDIDNEKTRRKYYTGYRKIDLLARPEAGKITLIPAFTDHGKSVLLRNIAVNMYRGYDDLEIMYYTFEDNCYEVMMHMARLVYDMEFDKNTKTEDKMNSMQFEDCIHRNNEIGAKAKNIMRHLSKRVFVYDRNVNVEQVEKQITDEIATHPKIGVVFIDYLQDIEPTQYTGQHHADLERIMIYMHDTAKKTGVAFIVAAQYRPDAKWKAKKWDIVGLTKVFGSSSLYKKPRLILSLFNRTRHEYNFEHKDNDALIDELEIDILKQKRQEYGRYLTFDLCRRSGRIIESDRVITPDFDIEKGND